MDANNGIAASIRAYITESFLLDQGELDDAASLIDTGVIDSIGVMEVVAFLEDTFGVTVDDSELVPENLDSVERLARFVERKRTDA